MRKTSWKAAPLCCDLNVYQLCWSHEIWLTRSLPLTCCATHSIAVSLCIVWHFPDGRVRLTIVASFRVATRDLAMWQRWQCCPLQPVWVRKVTVRQDFHKWVSDSNRISGNWRAACKQPREGASTTDPVGHATCNSNSNSNFDLCNCPALCAVAVCHLGSISSSLLELFVASSGYQQISKQPL